MDELSNIQRSNASADVGYPATVRACKADGKSKELDASDTLLSVRKCLKGLTLI